MQQESIEIFIATNGRRLADRTFFDSIIQYDICSFDLSIQGLSKSDYIANTGVDGFADYLKAVENLQENNIHFVNTFVITELKEERIIELFDFVKRYRIDNLIIEFEKGVVGSSDCQLKVKECAKFVETVFNIFKNSGIHYTIATSFPLCLIERLVLFQLIEKQCISTACHVQRKNVLTIDPECHLLPCSAFVDYPFDDNKAVLKGARYVSQYMSTNSCDEFYNRSKVYPSDNCTDCEFWDLCGGGCFVRWFFEDPSEVIVNKEHKQSTLSKLLATHRTGTATAAPESMRNPYTGIDSKY